MSLKHMKTLIVLVVGFLAVGCGKTEPMGSGNEYNAELAIDQNTTKAEPVKELTPEQKQKALRDSVVGEYESKYENGDTFKHVYLENGVYEFYSNGKKQVELKWSIIDGEIHVEYSSGGIDIYRINPDKSITSFAGIENGKRKDIPKEFQNIKIKIK